MESPRKKRRPRGPAVELFLVSAAALALEVLQVRLFAFVLWHHLAFLVISMALLGFGAAGAVLSAFPGREGADGAARSTGRAALGFALTAPLGPWLLGARPVDLFHPMGGGEVLLVLLYYGVLALPYFFAGRVIARALARAGARPGPVYAVNLAGSALGCFLVLPLLGPLGAEGCLFLLAALGCAAALAGTPGRRGRVLAAGAGCLALAAVPAGPRLLPLRPAASKSLRLALDQRGMTPLFTQWTPLCRIDACGAPGRRARLAFQDGDAPTLLPNTLAPTPEGDLRHLPYLLLHEPKVLVLGLGGGPDAKVALEHGARSLDGVDVNPVMLRLCLDPAFNAAAKLFRRRAGARFHAAEGRFFVRRSKETYDLIQMTGVDTYTALVSGAFVLTESFLYTREAFRDYLDHLAEGGVLSIVRFAFPAPRETLRVAVMACRALREAGAAAPWRHVAVVKREKALFLGRTAFAAVLVKKRPFTAEETGALRMYAERHGLEIAYLPGREDPPSNAYRTYMSALRAGREEAFLRDYPYDVRPVTDDRPFFFNQFRFSALWAWIGSAKDAPREEKPGADAGPEHPWLGATSLFKTKPVGLLLLFLTLAQALFLALLLVLGPLCFTGRGKPERHGSALPALSFFALLGLGYILLVIATMERFTLVLGHPGYAVPVTLAAFLLFSGAGSLFCARIPGRFSVKALGLAAALLLLFAAGLHFLLPYLTQAVLGRPFFLRVLFSLSVIAPQAFVMGWCFPLGLRLLHGRRPSLVPWAYGVNSAATVVGSVLVAALAMAMGFQAVQWIAAGLYVLAAAAGRGLGSCRSTGMYDVRTASPDA